MIPNCNKCDQDCHYTFKVGKEARKGMLLENLFCRIHRPPKDTWMLAELALVNPTSLNKALSKLPFEVRLDFYLK